MPTLEELTSWHAENWESLSQYWNDLSRDEAARPAFRGEAISDAEAGYVFQTLVIEGFRLSGVECEPPFRVPLNPGVDDRTQCEIDGLVISGWQGLLVESKFDRIDFGPIARLHLLAEVRPVGTLGLLFAAKGFTVPAVESAHILRPIRVLMFDQGAIAEAFKLQSFLDEVRIKWQWAVKYGRSNLTIPNRDQQG